MPDIVKKIRYSEKDYPFPKAITVDLENEAGKEIEVLRNGKREMILSPGGKIKRWTPTDDVLEFREYVKPDPAELEPK